MKTIKLTKENHEEVFASCKTIVNGYEVLRYNEVYNKGYIVPIVKISKVDCFDRIKPEIYVKNLYFSDIQFAMQTTSYGALDGDELDEFASKVNLAVSTIKYLESTNWDEMPFIEKD